MLMAEILERKPAEVIEREAIQKLISIAGSNQDHLRDQRECSYQDDNQDVRRARSIGT